MDKPVSDHYILYLADYVATYETMANAMQITPAVVQRMCSRRPVAHWHLMSRSISYQRRDQKNVSISAGRLLVSQFAAPGLTGCPEERER